MRSYLTDICHICTDDYYVFLESDNKSPAVTVISDYDWSDSLSGCFCFRQPVLHEVGGARPLSVSGSRYKMLNVITDASSIVTKKMIMCFVCLSIGSSFGTELNRSACFF